MIIIHKFNKLNTLYNSDRFILSALNLAFLGFLEKGEITINKFYYLWPDGIFAKFYNFKKKISGQQLIKKIYLNNKNISNIVILGNSSQKIEKFLTKKFKKKVKSINLPNAKVKKIIKELPKINKKDLYLITLPTPKQEIIASYISKKYSYFKLICIGGGLAVAAGEIKSCPKFLEKIGLEFIWRFRTDFIRRLSRLIISFYWFSLSLFKKKKLYFR